MKTTLLLAVVMCMIGCSRGDPPAAPVQAQKPVVAYASDNLSTTAPESPAIPVIDTTKLERAAQAPITYQGPQVGLSFNDCLSYHDAASLGEYGGLADPVDEPATVPSVDLTRMRECPQMKVEMPWRDLQRRPDGPV